MTRLQQMRIILGRTVPQHARAVGVHPTNIYRIEAGSQPAGVPTQEKFASALGVATWDLFDPSGWPLELKEGESLVDLNFGEPGERKWALSLSPEQKRVLSALDAALSKQISKVRDAAAKKVSAIWASTDLEIDQMKAVAAIEAARV